MNGSRADENTISVDGAIAIRTRSAGTIIGVQNVDAIQEVQVLTANYMPEYGRASGGQIRFITKSGSSRYSGSASFFYRDDKLQANTWGRNRSPNAIENSGPAPFDYKQYGWSLGGPIPGEWFKNKLFFFAAQEWVNYFAVATNTAAVPTDAMKNGDFSQLLGTNPWYSTPQLIRDPLTGLPFPGNIIPANRLSPNGIALMKLYPSPTPGYQTGTANLIMNSENPQDQRKDNLRFDYRLRNNHSFTFRYSKQNWVAIDAFRGTFPFARTDWDRPNTTMNVNWAWTVSNNLINEASYSYSIDQVFINVFTEPGLHKRSRTGVNYPYIYPGKEIEDKIPTINIDKFSTIDGGPYPSSSEGPIHLWTDTVTWVKGRHTLKAGVAIEYSGEDDFDQINVNSIPGGTNNQNGQFDFRNASSGRSGVGIADMALGIFTNYAEIGERARTNWRALATDIFVQDSWRPNDKVTVEGGFRYAIWPPWYSTTNNIANFDPRFYDRNNQAVINPSTGRLISGPRYNGIVLPGDGFVGEGNDLKVASDPAVQALFRGEPRGFSQTHFDLFEPRVGMSYAWNDKTVFRGSAGIFHNRVTLNDSTLLGGNPPFQPMVTVSNGSIDNPGGVAFANDLPFGMQGQDVVFKLPASYMYSVGVQRQLPWKIVMDVNYVGRQGRFLQRERNINQLLPGTHPGQPRRQHRRAAPLQGLRRAARDGELRPLPVQQPPDQRRAALLERLQAERRLHLRQVVRQRQRQAQRPLELVRRRQLLGAVELRPDARAGRLLHLRPAVLARPEHAAAQPPRRLADLRLHLPPVRDALLDHPRPTTSPAWVKAATASRWISWVTSTGTRTGSSRPAAASTTTSGSTRPRSPIRPRASSATRRATSCGTRARSSGTSRCSRTSSSAGSHRLQFRAEVFNFINHPNLSGPNTDITNSNFGRIITKDGSRRDIQLALRYTF